MSVQEKLTAIAVGIRGKTGLTGPLTLDQMAIDIAASPSVPVNVPDYVQAEAARVASLVAAVQNENTISFIALSDLHARESHQDSIRHAAQAAGIIKGRIPIDFTAVLGDIAYGAYGDTCEAHMANLLTAAGILSAASPDLRLDGNHDSNIYVPEISLTPEHLHRYTCRFNNPRVTMPDTDRGYFHYDLADKKLRVICLNSADLKDISPSDPRNGHHISAQQLSWLVSVLDMTGMEDWSMILLAHHPIHWAGAMENVLTLLDAYVAGAGAEVTADGQTVSCDFSGKNGAKLIGTFHGHTHNLISGRSGLGKIIRMGTPNACYDRNNEYGSASSYPDETFRKNFGETATYAKTADSKNDTAFVVYTIDTAAQAIYATCYGAGYDRTVSYAASGENTNLVPTSIDSAGAVYNGTGCKENYRLNSSGGESAASGCVVSGFIPVQSGDIIQVYGSRTADISGNNHSGFYVNGYNSAFQFLEYLAPTDAAGNDGEFDMSGEKVLWTVDTALFGTMPSYIRASMAQCSGEEFVVSRSSGA